MVRTTTIQLDVPVRARLADYTRYLIGKTNKDLDASDVVDSLLDAVGWPKKPGK